MMCQPQSIRKPWVHQPPTGAARPEPGLPASAGANHGYWGHSFRTTQNATRCTHDLSWAAPQPPQEGAVPLGHKVGRQQTTQVLRMHRGGL